MNMRKAVIFFIGIISTNYSFAQSIETLNVQLSDTLSKKGKIIYNNQTTEIIYTYTAVYNITESQILVKNLFDVNQRKRNSYVLTLKKINPNTSSKFILFINNFSALRNINNYVIFKTTFYNKKEGKKVLVKEIKKKVFLTK